MGREHQLRALSSFRLAHSRCLFPIEPESVQQRDLAQRSKSSFFLNWRWRLAQRDSAALGRSALCARPRCRCICRCQNGLSNQSELSIEDSGSSTPMAAALAMERLHLARLVLAKRPKPGRRRIASFSSSGWSRRRIALFAFRRRLRRPLASMNLSLSLGGNGWRKSSS